LYLPRILNACKQFVQKNPSETILVLLSWSQESATLRTANKWLDRYTSQDAEENKTFKEIRQLLEARTNWWTGPS
jgi:hypothetical protein